ncbi:MAG: 30S ribosomal protein S6 [Candidatus Latescibacteria bacterium]|nr:30S ribosomal protein S6 [Candidatus Latescibacterota bacterium]
MKKYDTTFVIDGTLDQNQREEIIEKYEKSLKKLGGEFDRIIRWGMRKLAYEIKKRTHGYYVIFYYSAEPSAIKPFEAEMKLNENILRFMTILFDGKHPENIRDEGAPGSEKIVTVDSTEDIQPFEDDSLEIDDDIDMESVDDESDSDETESLNEDEIDDDDEESELSGDDETEDIQDKEDK